MPMDLTVDVGVVMSGSGLGAPEHRQSSLDLMKAVESETAFLLALDSKGRIRHQYNLMVKRGFGYYWLQRLAAKGSITVVKWKRLNRGAVVALVERHFDPEDMKYVETAAGTSCKILVSHDPDYSPSVRKVLRKSLGVKVLHAKEAADAE